MGRYTRALVNTIAVMYALLALPVFISVGNEVLFQREFFYRTPTVFSSQPLLNVFKKSLA